MTQHGQVFDPTWTSLTTGNKPVDLTTWNKSVASLALAIEFILGKFCDVGSASSHNIYFYVSPCLILKAICAILNRLPKSEACLKFARAMRNVNFTL